jgi:hypothetical protein
MKHAGVAALARLEPLLAEVRTRALVEKKLGVFYRKSRAFLHFHEDPAGLFADWRPADEWLRLPVNSAAERRALIKQLDEFLLS